MHGLEGAHDKIRGQVWRTGSCLFAVVVKVVTVVCVIVVRSRHACNADSPTSCGSARVWSDWRYRRPWFAGARDVIAVYDERVTFTIELAPETPR